MQHAGGHALSEQRVAALAAHDCGTATGHSYSASELFAEEFDNRAVQFSTARNCTGHPVHAMDKTAIQFDLDRDTLLGQHPP